MQPIHEKIPSLTLETERLWLKAIQPEHLSQIYGALTPAEQQQFFGFATAAEMDLERDKYRQGLTMYRISFRSFLMINKADDLVIGRLGYHYWYVPHLRAEVGYALHADHYKGKGYMREALQPVIAHGFDAMGLNRIEAMIAPTNTPSLALVQRLGFVKEGYLRHHYRGNGILEDSLVFSLLKDEYLQKG